MQEQPSELDLLVVVVHSRLLVLLLLFGSDSPVEVVINVKRLILFYVMFKIARPFRLRGTRQTLKFKAFGIYLSPQYSLAAEFEEVLEVHQACGNVLRIEEVRLCQERVKGG